MTLKEFCEKWCKKCFEKCEKGIIRTPKYIRCVDRNISERREEDEVKSKSRNR